MTGKIKSSVWLKAKKNWTTEELPNWCLKRKTVFSWAVSPPTWLLEEDSKTNLCLKARKRSAQIQIPASSLSLVILSSSKMRSIRVYINSSLTHSYSGSRGRCKFSLCSNCPSIRIVLEAGPWSKSNFFKTIPMAQTRLWFLDERLLWKIICRYSPR